MSSTDSHRREVRGISFRDVHGIAEELGVDVQTVRRWIHSGRLRAFKPGKEYRVRESDLEEFLAAREVRPKVEAPREKGQPSFNDALADERRLRDLQGWRSFRAFVHGLARRWEETPPKTAAEIAPIFETLTALAEQGVFEPSAAPDMREVEEMTLIMVGFERLNEIASKVEEGEQTEQQRSAVIRDIREKFSA